MTQQTEEETTSSFIVKDTMNSHGALTVEAVDGHATYHIVDYADTETRERLSSLTPGSKIRMVVERAGVRANVWKATKLVTGTGKKVSVSV
jgi:hypothetical protein